MLSSTFFGKAIDMRYSEEYSTHKIYLMYVYKACFILETTDYN